MSTAALTPVPLQMLAPRSPPTHPAHRASAPAATPAHAAEGATYAGDVNGTVHFRFHLPHATSAAMVPASTTTLSGDVDPAQTPLHPATALQKQADGVWSGTATYPVGLHKVVLLVDGRVVLTPHLPVACERGQELVNYIDVPPTQTARCCYILRPRTEHGTVAQDYVDSYTTDTVEEVLVYLPPSYHKASSATRRYPVLYLLHEDGDHGMGGVQHGKVNIIADNLIADGKMVDMIIVMKSVGSAVTQDPFSHDITQMCDDVTEDIIPFVDNRYRTLADRDNRAIAGLSMGSMQASRLSITRPDLFAYAGIFSGFLRLLRTHIDEDDDHMDVLRRDPAAYQSAMKVFFRCMGDEDAHMPRFEEDDALLAELGVECTRRIYKGPHSWHVWRQAAPDFLPVLFKAGRK